MMKKIPRHVPCCSDCRRRPALSNSDLCRACWQGWWVQLHTTAGRDAEETLKAIEAE